MVSPISLARRAHYTAAQVAKMGWYTAQYVSARHLSGPFTPPGEVPRPFRSARMPKGAMQKSVAALITAEADDIAKGTYKVPADMRRPPRAGEALTLARDYFREVRHVSQRAHRKGGGTEVRDAAPPGYPAYYRQNFHFQSDGWLSDHSARIYDTQVEALFTGVAAPMRRRALPFLLAELQRLRRAGVSLPAVADLGCGTAPLLADLVDNDPAITPLGVDLSSAYLSAARRRVPELKPVLAAAEALPFGDRGIDLLYSVYLFHELPPKVRREVARSIARVIRPGGLYVHVDTAQYGDTEMDLLLESFPRAFHEPFYEGYCQEDLHALFAEAGFAVEAETVGFLTKVTAFRRQT